MINASFPSGFDYPASCRRVCGTYRREAVDRVPILSPISWSPEGDVDATEFGDWRDEERYRRIARLVQQHCDVEAPHNQVKAPRIFEPQGYQRFLEAQPEHVEALPPERISEIRTRYTTLLHTPKGDLRWAYEEDQGVLTRWDRVKPVQCVEDVDRLLSAPYRFRPPNPAEFEPFRQHRAEMGADSIDPVEPAPQGDAAMAEVKKAYAGKLLFRGNIEFLDLETRQPDEIETLVRQAIEASGKQNMMLKPSAGPHERPSDLFLANAERYLEAGVKYGRLSE